MHVEGGHEDRQQQAFVFEVFAFRDFANFDNFAIGGRKHRVRALWGTHLGVPKKLKHQAKEADVEASYYPAYERMNEVHQTRNDHRACQDNKQRGSSFFMDSHHGLGRSYWNLRNCACHVAEIAEIGGEYEKM